MVRSGGRSNPVLGNSRRREHQGAAGERRHGCSDVEDRRRSHDNDNDSGNGSGSNSSIGIGISSSSSSSRRRRGQRRLPERRGGDDDGSRTRDVQRRGGEFGGERVRAFPDSGGERRGRAGESKARGGGISGQGRGELSPKVFSPATGSRRPSSPARPRTFRGSYFFSRRGYGLGSIVAERERYAHNTHTHTHTHTHVYNIFLRMYAWNRHRTSSRFSAFIRASSCRYFFKWQCDICPLAWNP
jgi:hypothetical protein